MKTTHESNDGRMGLREFQFHVQMLKHVHLMMTHTLVPAIITSEDPGVEDPNPTSPLPAADGAMMRGAGARANIAALDTKCTKRWRPFPQ